jgi:hypothetical protein
MNLALASLHKHWIAAYAVNYHLRRSSKLPLEEYETLPKEVTEAGMFHSTFIVLGVWYGLLFVVIEGYREVEGRDSEIDGLLASEVHVDSLRRFRNATFHYQKDPISPKLMEFLEVPESEIWIRKLNSAFQRYFERELNIREILLPLQREEDLS